MKVKIFSQNAPSYIFDKFLNMPLVFVDADADSPTNSASSDMKHIHVKINLLNLVLFKQMNTFLELETATGGVL